MSNIRVDLNAPIQDGTEVVFRSPVDCSQITGLIVYYQKNGNTASKEFAFADAHGNNVGDIDNLFAENVAVKVILDVTTSMAFVQNADTNAYLEGRFAELIRKLDVGENAVIINLADYSPAVGTFNTKGEYIGTDYSINRVANQDLIPVKNGFKVTAANGYAFNAAKFDSDGKFIEYGTFGYTDYEVNWDGYIRLSIGYDNHDVAIAHYAPAVGTVSIYDGSYADILEGVVYTNRVANQNLIPVCKGDSVTASNGYAFNVFKFDKNGNFTGRGTYGYTEYVVDWDGYVRLAIGSAQHTDMTGFVDEACKSLHITSSCMIGYVDDACKCISITRAFDAKAEIDKVRQEINSLRGGNIKFDMYAPAVGSVSLTYGDYGSEIAGQKYVNRVVNQDLIPVKNGDTITASNGYKFNIFKFDANGMYTGERGTYGYTDYAVDWDGYLRLAIGHDDHPDMTDYLDEACASVSTTAVVNTTAEIVNLKRGQANVERRKYLFNFPYGLDHLYVCDYENMENLAGYTPADFHAKMDMLCINSNGYLTRTELGKDAWGNALYKYVFEPNVPYINCSRNENAGRPFDGVKIDTPTIIILSGIHGLEASNDYAVYNFLKDLLTNRNEALNFIFRNLRLVFVPAICATGLSKTGEGQYRNDNNINLNRAFPSTESADPYVTVTENQWGGFDTVYDPSGTLYADEVKCVMNVIDEYKDAIALVDMHTHKTYDVMSWNYTDDEVFKYVATRVANDLTNDWLDKYPDVEFDTVNGSHNPATKVWVYHSANVAGTSSTYASKVHGIPAGTIEARRKQPVDNVHHGQGAVAFSYDILVNFIISFCRTIA